MFHPPRSADYRDDLITEVNRFSATITYEGQAPPGTLTSTAQWRIKRITTSVDGNDISIRFAGKGGFTEVWDNLA